MIARPQDLEIADLKAEIERLQQKVKQVQGERDQDRQTLAKLQEERDAYLHFLLAELKKQYSSEELEKWGKEVIDSLEKGNGKWFTFEEILEEIEPILEKDPCPEKANSESSIPKR